MSKMKVFLNDLCETPVFYSNGNLEKPINLYTWLEPDLSDKDNCQFTIWESIVSDVLSQTLLGQDYLQFYRLLKYELHDNFGHIFEPEMIEHIAQMVSANNLRIWGNILNPGDVELFEKNW